MKAKAKCKIAIDAAMTLGLLFLMGYQLWGDVAHEWAGAGIFVLFIAHHVLNRNWYKNLSRGKYSPSRVFQLAVDGMVFLAMLGLMASGIMLSNHVFAFLDIHGGMSFARLLHMAASYWGFVLMSLHLGLHWGMFTGLARKALRLKSPSRARKFLLPIVAAAIAAYGLFAFIQRGLPTYMLVRKQFVFLDFSEPPLLFYLDYLAMMGTFICLGHYLSKLLQRVAKGRRSGTSAGRRGAFAGQKQQRSFRRSCIMKKSIGNALALYPTPLAVVGAMVDGKPNWLLVGHVGIIGHDHVMVSLASAHYTNKGIKASGKLSINIVDEALLPMADRSGCISGGKEDKSTLFDYVLDDAGVPMIQQAPVTMVCSVEDVYNTKGFESFICTINATYAEESVLNEAGRIDYRALKPVLFEMPTYEYLRTGDVIGKCMSIGKEPQK